VTQARGGGGPRWWRDEAASDLVGESECGGVGSGGAPGGRDGVRYI
jgi:hypothetical protein